MSSNQPQREPNEKTKFSFYELFKNNTFVLIISLIIAIVAWFAISMANVEEGSVKTISDIPIEVELSTDAQSEGLKVFNKSHETADITITGNTLITNKLTAKDFRVIASYSPSSTKTSGTGIKTETILLKAQKAGSELADYDITSISPEEISIEVDKVKEVSLPIETNIIYTSDSAFYAGEPSLSDTSVTINGPEASVNKVSRVVLNYEISSPLKAEQRFSTGLTLYNQDNVEIKDYAGMYLTFSLESVEVVIPVYSKKTVPLKETTINAPEGFAEGRIELSPKTIDIAGTPEELAKVEQITLTDVIDFSEVTAGNTHFDIEIPIPAGVRNLSTIETASVDINLTGFQSTKLTTTNIKVTNVPTGKNVDIVTQSLPIELMGSESQISKLTGESIYCTLDMTGKGDLMGSVDLPVLVVIRGANTCWTIGKYSITVNITNSSETYEASAQDASNVSQSAED